MPMPTMASSRSASAQQLKAPNSDAAADNNNSSSNTTIIITSGGGGQSNPFAGCDDGAAEAALGALDATVLGLRGLGDEGDIARIISRQRLAVGLGGLAGLRGPDSSGGGAEYEFGSVRSGGGASALFAHESSVNGASAANGSNAGGGGGGGVVILSPSPPAMPTPMARSLGTAVPLGVGGNAPNVVASPSPPSEGIANARTLDGSDDVFSGADSATAAERGEGRRGELSMDGIFRRRVEETTPSTPIAPTAPAGTEFGGGSPLCGTAGSVLSPSSPAACLLASASSAAPLSIPPSQAHANANTAANHHSIAATLASLGLRGSSSIAAPPSVSSSYYGGSVGARPNAASETGIIRPFSRYRDSIDVESLSRDPAAVIVSASSSRRRFAQQQQQRTRRGQRIVSSAESPRFVGEGIAAREPDEVVPSPAPAEAPFVTLNFVASGAATTHEQGRAGAECRRESSSPHRRPFLLRARPATPLAPSRWLLRALPPVW